MDLKNEARALEYIQSAIANNKLVLPTLPEVALSVRQAVNSGKVSDAELARVISGDPGLATRLLQVANSPLYRARQKIESLQMAITRMGHNVIRNLITSLAMQQVFNPQSPLLASYFHATWKHSVNIASVSRALALHCRHLDKEQAMLAGLIHQIGKLPILTLAEKFPELAQDRAALDHLLNALHPTIGKIIMESWDLPEGLRKAAWEYLDFHRDPAPEADYVDVVQVAYIENELVTNPSFADLVNVAAVPAFHKLGLDPDIEVLEIEGVAEEVAAAEQIFI
ncbi:HDOD domain-containing protein [Methylococcus sp. EFPC2]|uniref:HDOD domain-containing protein n=1 Tax=Methylococcus sp. EFPC2 TaxID=2812648 RepID=UPI0019677633|nr:HDOD domain-containing protein [Methylococcus sp. EFPC2]QSA98551.1 HDOD domain-containing protein [Methylococcus sp. EFPC2]